jgi:hypothetical protein
MYIFFLGRSCSSVFFPSVLQSLTFVYGGCPNLRLGDVFESGQQRHPYMEFADGYWVSNCTAVFQVEMVQLEQLWAKIFPMIKEERAAVVVHF